MCGRTAYDFIIQGHEGHWERDGEGGGGEGEGEEQGDRASFNQCPVDRQVILIAAQTTNNIPKAIAININIPAGIAKAGGGNTTKNGSEGAGPLMPVPVPVLALPHSSWGFSLLSVDKAIGSTSSLLPDKKFFLTNTRDDTTSSKLTKLLNTKRCLIPLKGWYEWTDFKDPSTGKQSPYYFYLNPASYSSSTSSSSLLSTSSPTFLSADPPSVLEPSLMPVTVNNDNNLNNSKKKNLNEGVLYAAGIYITQFSTSTQKTETFYSILTTDTLRKELTDIHGRMPLILGFEGSGPSTSSSHSSSSSASSGSIPSILITNSDSCSALPSAIQRWMDPSLTYAQLCAPIPLRVTPPNPTSSSYSNSDSNPNVADVKHPLSILKQACHLLENHINLHPVSSKFVGNVREKGRKCIEDISNQKVGKKVEGKDMRDYFGGIGNGGGASGSSDLKKREVIDLEDDVNEIPGANPFKINDGVGLGTSGTGLYFESEGEDVNELEDETEDELEDESHSMTTTPRADVKEAWSFLKRTSVHEQEKNVTAKKAATPAKKKSTAGTPKKKSKSEKVGNGLIMHITPKKGSSGKAVSKKSISIAGGTLSGIKKSTASSSSSSKGKKKELEEGQGCITQFFSTPKLPEI